MKTKFRCVLTFLLLFAAISSDAALITYDFSDGTIPSIISDTTNLSVQTWGSATYLGTINSYTDSSLVFQESVFLEQFDLAPTIPGSYVSSGNVIVTAFNEANVDVFQWSLGGSTDGWRTVDVNETVKRIELDVTSFYSPLLDNFVINDAIPEPSTIAFLGFFGCGIFAVRRLFLI